MCNLSPENNTVPITHFSDKNTRAVIVVLYSFTTFSTVTANISVTATKCKSHYIKPVACSLFGTPDEDLYYNLYDKNTGI